MKYVSEKLGRGKINPNLFVGDVWIGDPSLAGIFEFCLMMEVFE